MRAEVLLDELNRMANIVGAGVTTNNMVETQRFLCSNWRYGDRLGTGSAAPYIYMHYTDGSLNTPK
jgi:hypothetical protein